MAGEPAAKGEFAFIDGLRKQTATGGLGPRVPLGPGGGPAIPGWPERVPCLVTTGVPAEGGCFLHEEAGAGAGEGDWSVGTGALGGSILGKHVDFTPRVREALLLHQRADLHAMIDLSDGLAADLGHLCDESGVGAVLQAEAIPLTAEARQ